MHSFGLCFVDMPWDSLVDGLGLEGVMFSVDVCGLPANSIFAILRTNSNLMPAEGRC